MVKKFGKEKELEDIKNQLKRALADYSNFQRRVEEEKKSLVNIANGNLLGRFLGILDVLEQGVKHEQNEGIDLAVKKFKEVLASENVKEIEALGQKFNPALQEAVEVVKGGQEDKVIEVLEKGYMLEGKVIRPAKVRVSKKTASSEAKINHSELKEES